MPNVYKLHLVLALFISCLTFPHFTCDEAAALPKPRLSTKSLDLSRAPSTSELMAAGQLGGLLYPTDDIDIAAQNTGKGSLVSAQVRKNAEINLSFGKAIEKWNRHDYEEAVELFKHHVEDYPGSPWAAESILHVGCDARYKGRYPEAEESFNWIINKYHNQTHPGAKRLVNKARKRLGVLRVIQNDFDSAVDEFSKLKRESSDWKHRVYASNWLQKLSRMKHNKLAAMTCGSQALAVLLESEGKPELARDVLSFLPETPEGHTIADLEHLAQSYGYNLQTLRLGVAQLQELSLPAIVHLEGRGGGTGHYWILEGVEDQLLHLYDPQSRRRFSHSFDTFERQWDGIVMTFTSDQTSQTHPRLTQKEQETYSGGCCGKAMEPTDNGSPGENGANQINNASQTSSTTQIDITPTTDNSNVTNKNPPNSSCGSPTWDVNVMSLNLYVKDIPLWYSTAIGPDIGIALSYNSQSSLVSHDPFGNKWQFAYASYITVDPGGNVDIVMPDGKNDIYTPDGSGGYTSPFKVFNTLVKIADNHFELHYQNGSVYEYNIPAGTSSLQPFLISIRDAYNQAITLEYDEDVQLSTITDALGQVTTLTYNPDGLVTQVDDPFGRTAVFEYDQNRNLIAITDMGGYRSTLSYDDDIYLTSLGNPRGSYIFDIEPADGIVANADNYTPPDGIMWDNYRITITNPEGDKSEFFYYGGYDDLGAGYTWYISPNHYIPWQSNQVNNYRVDTPRTRYFFTYLPSGERGAIEKVTYAEGGAVSYGYDASTGMRTSIIDSLGNESLFTFNGKGNLLSTRRPNGEWTYYTYDTNGIDLISISDDIGTVTMTYNNHHDLTDITNKKGDTITFEYDTFGKILTTTKDASGLNYTTDFLYNPESHQLEEVQKEGETFNNFTHDSIGRVRTMTDGSGLMLTYDYNALNYITQVTWPDGKTEITDYADCCTRIIDRRVKRDGRTYTYEYDSLKRLISQKNSEKAITHYEYDANGNLTSLIDPNGNTTRFKYDAANRLTRKSYADGSNIQYWYDTENNIIRREDERGIVTRYSYDNHYNLLEKRFSDGTPQETYLYDEFDRIIQTTDGLGVTTYLYDQNSNLLEKDGPWDNDTITYTYDAVDRKTSVTAQGSQTITYHYDNLDRLLQVGTTGNLYEYIYNGTIPLIQALVRPNTSQTDYSYDNVNRLTGISDKKSNGEVISNHTFTYNQQDLKETETIISSGRPAVNHPEIQQMYSYNNLNQVQSIDNPETIYTYDASGNLATEAGAGTSPYSFSFDAENRLVKATEVSGETTISHVFSYYTTGLLGQVTTYHNDSEISQLRILRDDFLSIQDRDSNNNVLRSYVYGIHGGGGIGGLLELDQGGDRYSYLYDGKANVVGLIDSAQQPVVEYNYTSFGEEFSSNSNFTQPFTFSTKRSGLVEDLIYYGYRFYSPKLARWINRDPLSEEGGINLYGFVEQNPVNKHDPYGLEVTSFEMVKQVPGGLTRWEVTVEEPSKSGSSGMCPGGTDTLGPNSKINIHGDFFQTGDHEIMRIKIIEECKENNPGTIQQFLKGELREGFESSEDSEIIIETPTVAFGVRG